MIKHRNSIPFEGILTHVDVPSDGAPAGSYGHRVILTRDAAEAAIPSLIGMGVGFASDYATHNKRQKCGVISSAWIEGNDLHVRGYIYGEDFPEVVAELRKPRARMGMSYEMLDAKVRDMGAEIYVLWKVTFSGAAIVLASGAAYKSTLASLSACEERFTGRLKFPASKGTIKLTKAPKTARAARTSKPR